MRWFRTMPMWALVPILFVVVGGAWLLIGLVTMPRDQPIAIRLIGTVWYGGVMAAVFGVWIARARRRAGGAAELHTVQQGLRRGEVPEGVDVSAWSATADVQRRQLRRNLWLGPLVFGLMIVLALWLALSQSPVWWFGVVFFVGFLTWSVVSTPRLLRSTERVREELRRRSGAEGPIKSDT